MTGKDYDPPLRCTLDIRRNSDGEVRRSKEIWDFHGDFIWDEGNFACDCNRSLFFFRAADEQEPEVKTCGRGAFSVRLTTEDGAIVYQDGEWP